MTSCLRFGSEAIQALPDRVPDLRLLNLAYGPHLDGSALEALGRLAHLRELVLSGIGMEFTRRSPFGPLMFVKERRIPRLDQLASLSELHSLELGNCAEIPVAELRALA